MTEQVWINVAHIVLAVAALVFAVWTLIKLSDSAARYDVLAALGFMALTLGSIFIAIMAILLAVL